MLRSSANFLARGEVFTSPLVGAETVVVVTALFSTFLGMDGVSVFGASSSTSFFSSFGAVSFFVAFYIFSFFSKNS